MKEIRGLSASFFFALFQGTSADQDNRFSDKEKKLLKQMKFDESLAVKIDIKKVNKIFFKESW